MTEEQEAIRHSIVVDLTEGGPLAACFDEEGRQTILAMDAELTRLNRELEEAKAVNADILRIGMNRQRTLEESEATVARLTEGYSRPCPFCVDSGGKGFLMVNTPDKTVPCGHCVNGRVWMMTRKEVEEVLSASDDIHPTGWNQALRTILRKEGK